MQPFRPGPPHGAVAGGVGGAVGGGGGHGPAYPTATPGSVGATPSLPAQASNYAASALHHYGQVDLTPAGMANPTHGGMVAGPNIFPPATQPPDATQWGNRVRFDPMFPGQTSPFASGQVGQVPQHPGSGMPPGPPPPQPPFPGEPDNDHLPPFFSRPGQAPGQPPSRTFGPL